MHRILGTNECVANYLDGGFMRGLWCLSHAGALLLLPIAIFILTKPSWLLWPGHLLFFLEFSLVQLIIMKRLHQISSKLI